MSIEIYTYHDPYKIDKEPYIDESNITVNLIEP